ncbi:MAG: TfoX/Sxy family protein [Leptolyngbyaceae cyanobacterium SM2_5_2]|nr:TfoX/Sxy family protein [Leptolyngbyaceae cyanobacterium SM2_5_2]
MPSSESKAFKDAVVTYLNQVAPVTSRAMFGGYGLYLEGVMFALIAYEILYFKVDDGNRPDYEAVGMGPFIYSRDGKDMVMSYYQIPSTVYEDLATLDEWVEKALAAARRGKRKKRS